MNLEALKDDGSHAKALGADIMRASDVKPKKLARVWNGRFYRGKLGFLAGEPGESGATRTPFPAHGSRFLQSQTSRGQIGHNAPAKQR